MSHFPYADKEIYSHGAYKQNISLKWILHPVVINMVCSVRNEEDVAAEESALHNAAYLPVVLA